MTKKQANYRLDESLLNALSDRANSEGLKATDIVEKALQLYLGFTIQNPIQDDSNLNERISALLDERIAKFRDETIEVNQISVDKAIAPLLTRIENLEYDPMRSAIASEAESKQVLSESSSVEPEVILDVEAIAVLTTKPKKTKQKSILSITEAMAIAAKHGYTGSNQNMVNWSKRSFISATEQAKADNRDKLAVIGLAPIEVEGGYAWTAL